MYYTSNNHILYVDMILQREGANGHQSSADRLPGRTRRKSGGELFRTPERRLLETFLYSHNSAKMKTTWKDIAPVPTSQEFLDIVLSRTQRRLPTQIRAGFKISRIRGVFFLSPLDFPTFLERAELPWSASQGRSNQDECCMDMERRKKEEGATRTNVAWTWNGKKREKSQN
jgi:hypothetical protein